MSIKYSTMYVFFITCSTNTTYNKRSKRQARELATHGKKEKGMKKQLTGPEAVPWMRFFMTFNIGGQHGINSGLATQSQQV